MIPWKRGPVKQFNPYQFYNWGFSIHPLTSMNLNIGQHVKDIVWTLIGAKTAAADVFRQTVLPLPLSAAAAAELWNAITVIVLEDFAKVDMERDVFPYELWPIVNAATKFETIFAAELQNANTYSVVQKGIYNTADLIMRAEAALGEALIAISDPAKIDFGASGRCLAFELPTACGFHTMRATESVLRQYHRLLLGLPANRRSPEMAVCIDQLTKAGENQKLMESLDHIRGLHRNPLMHPEDFLTMDQALQLFDIAKSAITSMAKRITEINADPNLIIAAKAALAAAAPKKKKRGTP